MPSVSRGRCGARLRQFVAVVAASFLRFLKVIQVEKSSLHSRYRFVCSGG